MIAYTARHTHNAWYDKWLTQQCTKLGATGEHFCTVFTPAAIREIHVRQAHDAWVLSSYSCSCHILLTQLVASLLNTMTITRFSCQTAVQPWATLETGFGTNVLWFNKNTNKLSCISIFFFLLSYGRSR